MGVDATVALSQGDVLRRIRTLEKLVERLAADRNLEAASVGRGGLRIQGGRLLAEDQSGDRVFEVTTDPASIFMRQELIAQLALAIFASSITSVTATESVSTDSVTFVDLSGGPSVTVTIGESGRCLVGLNCQFSGVTEDVPAAAVGDHGARYGFRVSGATTLAGTTERSVAFQNTWISGSSATSRVDRYRLGGTVLVEGLNPGVHTITAQYASVSAEGVTPALVSFVERNLTVTAF